MKKLGIIGYPLGHSLSPKIFELISLPGSYIKIEHQDLKNAVNEAKFSNLDGFNVTIPFKVDILNYLDEIDETAERIGAVNTVKNINGKWKGYNTDGKGYILSVRKKINLKGKSVVILGSGGSAKSIGYELTQNNISSLIIASRNKRTRNNLSDQLSCYVKTTSGDISNLKQELYGASLIINTTPIGMYPNINNVPIPIEWVSSNCLVSDIVYNPRLTRFLSLAKLKGLDIHFGIEMLINQAKLAYQIWYGDLLDIDECALDVL